MSEAALQCEQLTITYPNGHCAVSQVSFAIESGECLALVGESGCGKTTLARAALGLLPAGTHVTGSLRVNGVEVVGASESQLRQLRGRVAGIVAQDPFGACHPLMRVYDHVAEAWRAHHLPPPANEIIEQLSVLGIADAANRAQQHPHQWSGGMLQRATITAATAHHPPLLIADEPTSALDAEHATAVLDLLRSLDAALLLISHDLQLVARYADRIAVCQAGRLVECGSARQVLQDPQHTYTYELIAAAQPLTEAIHTVAANEPVIVEARNVGKVYPRADGTMTNAVNNVSLRVRRGEIVGIAGPSGCGKSTLLRLLGTIEAPSAGEICLGGTLATRSNLGARNGYVMPIFQDPVSSLDPRWPVWRTVTEPLLSKQRADKPGRAERRTIARERLQAVGLNIDLEARPAQLSVGQCQRVAIARALIAQPALLIADEPTSALDAPLAREVLGLLVAAARAGTAIVIVSHDRQLLNALCHRVLGMSADGLRQV